MVNAMTRQLQSLVIAAMLFSSAGCVVIGGRHGSDRHWHKTQQQQLEVEREALKAEHERLKAEHEAEREAWKAEQERLKAEREAEREAQHPH
jgi:hypothetical protein